MFRKHEAEIGVEMVPFQMMVYVEDRDKYFPENEVPPGSRVLNLSGTQLRRRLNDGREIPAWFTLPEIARELRRTFPPRHKQGLSVFFTGLSGAGKSTIANVLLIKLLKMGGRPVTLLDGDLALLRKNTSTSELGFSKKPATSTFAALATLPSKNHEKRRYCHLRADRAVRFHAQGRAGNDRAIWRLHSGAPFHACRSLRAARPKRPLQPKPVPGF